MPEPHMRGADKQSVKLRKNLDEFWRKFAELAPKEELAEICSNPLCKWIFAMSTAPLREIRQSAVLAGLAVNVGLVSVGADIIQDMSNKHRMLTAAGSSKAGGAAQKEKLQRLQEEVRSLQETKVRLEEQMDTMVNAIFMHRHRDVVPSVRAACIAAMGDIITLCSSKFLNNGYLKYMGWALNDFGDQGGHVVRRAALDAIAQIYAMDPGKELDLFSDRFKKRIVEMRLDRDQRVGFSITQILDFFQQPCSNPESCLATILNLEVHSLDAKPLQIERCVRAPFMSRACSPSAVSLTTRRRKWFTR
jgi:cohesin complex subunit SA-1/2